MPQSLRRPELRWQPGARTPLSPEEITRRIGSTTAKIEPLPGGLMNHNVRIGEDRVLRVYPHEPTAAQKEAAILRHPWERFRVPGLLDAGDDFLLLEYVPHQPIVGSAEHGAAVGRALAEIHAMRFDAFGVLDRDLALSARFPGEGLLMGYAQSERGRAVDSLGNSELTDAVIDHLHRHGAALQEALGPPTLQHGDFKPTNLHWTFDDRLLVLDWEFAWAGSKLMDLGQLLRWAPPRELVDAFARSYRAHGGELPDQWQRWAAAADLCALLGTLRDPLDLRRVEDVRLRLIETLR